MYWHQSQAHPPDDILEMKLHKWITFSGRVFDLHMDCPVETDFLEGYVLPQKVLIVDGRPQITDKWLEKLINFMASS